MNTSLLSYVELKPWQQQYEFSGFINEPSRLSVCGENYYGSVSQALLIPIKLVAVTDVNRYSACRTPFV